MDHKDRTFLTPDQIKKVEEASKGVFCKSLTDIKRVVKEFVAHRAIAETSSMVDVPWVSETDSGVDKAVFVNQDIPLYKMLIDGFDMIKRRIEAAEKAKKQLEENELDGANLPFADVDKSRFNVDVLIEKRLGGKRQGLRIQWTVSEGCFELDPYTLKLFQVEKD